ncbi:MAG: ABC transporter ATP-binding protein, partial [Bifidobacteriaceae bacterium]|nr:ABC transporter ATP-binding protein [Bifidobacteriaceae bacterium]
MVATTKSSGSENDAVNVDSLNAKPAIEVKDLTKRFGDLTAVNGLSFQVKPGELFAFLGPNGSGKTTTIRCLTTLERPDAGQASVAGYRLGVQDDSIRRSIGVVFQDSVLDPGLTVRQNLALRAAMYGLNRGAGQTRIQALSAQVELGSFLDQRYGTLSGGQRRRADIARALVHQPAIVFLDEPTAGLDPHSREQVWRTVNLLRRDEGATVFLTTHYLAETEDADYVVLLDHGQSVAHGTPSELREQFSTSILTLTPAHQPAANDAVRRALAPWGGGIEVGGALRAEVGSAAQARQLLEQLGPAVEDFEFR